MNHKEWSRLAQQGGRIALALKEQGGYNVAKKPKNLMWIIQPASGGQIYGLVYLDRPVSDWRIIPEVESDEKKRLDQFLNKYLSRSSGR